MLTEADLVRAANDTGFQVEPPASRAALESAQRAEASWAGHQGGGRWQTLGSARDSQRSRS